MFVSTCLCASLGGNTIVVVDLLLNLGYSRSTTNQQARLEHVLWLLVGTWAWY